MRLFDRVKQIACTAVAVLAIGAITLCNVDVQAKTIAQPTQNYKYVYEIGNGMSVSNAVNLKINGKKYSSGSIKKKVKTVQTGKDANAYKSFSKSYIRYYDSADAPDSEDYYQQQQNYKYITTYNYSLSFLKAGTYTISFDKYSNGTDEIVKSADGKSETVTEVLEKTTYKYKIKVVNTANAVKKLALGKSSRTYTVKRSGTKVTTKTVVKNRYLTGKSGKLKISLNKGYKLTGAYAVTRNADGTISVKATGNNKKITYSVAKYSNEEKYDKVVTDPTTGKDKYVVEADGSYTLVTSPAVASKSASKYKQTIIYYGYKDSFTGDYTTYSIGAKTVYIPERDEDGYIVYQKDAAGVYVRDEDGNRIPVVKTVQATTIVEKYPVQTRVNGTYKIVEHVREAVILPTDKTLSDSSEYWLDAKGKVNRTSGSYYTVSRAGIPYYIALENGSYKENPAYKRAFYSNAYAGTWQVYTDAMSANGTDFYNPGSSYDDIDLKTGNITKDYVYVYKLDADGNRVYADSNLNYVDLDSTMSGVVTFNAK